MELDKILPIRVIKNHGVSFGKKTGLAKKLEYESRRNTGFVDIPLERE